MNEFVRCDDCLWTERNHFWRLILIGRVKNEYKLQFTEMKRVDPDSRQSGNAASAKLLTVNAKKYESMRVVRWNNIQRLR
jgi:hypothetical protein